MADFNVTIHSNRDQYDKELARVAEQVLTMWGILAETAAKRLSPVDTGNLRNSITYEVNLDDRSVTIGTNVEYAPYQELGTSRMKAKPYLRPAIEDHIDEYNDILKNALQS